jgi:RND family efflux transporter MFP subunit
VQCRLLQRVPRGRALLASLGPIALLGLGLLPACERTDEAPRAAVQPPTEEALLEVTTARVRRGSILQRIAAPGSLMPKRESRIGPEVRGRIEKIFVSEGDRVEAGDPLFQIDREPYELALRQAEAGLQRARAERKKIEADLARGRQLRAQDILTKQRMDELETGLAVAKAAVKEAEELVALARRDLENTLVRAPYAASVAARLEDEGTTALVQPQTIVLVLQETSELEAQATIPEVHFSAVKVGDAALLHVEGLAQPIATEVSAVNDAIDPATRTYLVKMRVPNEGRDLKAGTFARVEILPRAKNDVILVPRSAVRREDGRTQVMVVRDGRVVAQPVRLGIVSEDAVEVLRGVRVDDEIVVGDSARSVAPGMRVRAIPFHRVEGAAGSDAAAPDVGS